MNQRKREEEAWESALEAGEAAYATQFTVSAALAATLQAYTQAMTAHSVWDLEALEPGRVVVDCDGEPWQKQQNGDWVAHAADTAVTSLALEAYAPLHIAPLMGEGDQW